MMKYDSYKDSEIDRLGKIPATWNLDRIKNIGSVNGRVGWKALKASEYVDSGFFFLSTPNIKDIEIDFEKVNYITAERYYESPEIMLKIGDILLVKDGSTLGIVNVIRHLPKEGTVNSSIAVLRIKQFHSIYGYYFLLSNYIQNVIQLKKDGMGVPHLFQKDINNFEILVPSFAEQTAIASYLDNKTQAIDRKITLLEKKVGYYQELRRSLINETVTKGLDKNVKLKDSGIKWIGKIPEHWEIKRLKDYFKLYTGNSISDKSAHVNSVNAIPYVATKDINFHTGQIIYDNGVYIQEDDKAFKRAKPNTTLICIEGANAGKKIGFVNKDVAFVNKLCAIKSINRKFSNRYYYYLTQSYLFNYQFFSIINGLIGGVSVNQIKNFDIVVPNINEQQIIADYIDNKLNKIDLIISNLQTQIATLKELRKTLINDVVTGKIKVI